MVIAEEAEHDSLLVTHKVSDIGRYRLIAELARGGMGIVFLALVRGPGGFNKLFVVKVLKAHLSDETKLVYMFLEEARLAAKLNHPNVVQTIEVGSDGGRHFIAMEFLDGQSLHRLQARGRRTGTPFPLHYHLHILIQLLEGLQYAHGVTDFDGTPLSLVHRDVSPQNIIVTYEGQAKILDFGIAKAIDSANDTRTGMLKGKVAYMAPEQAAGEAVDRRTDLFAVGVMLWEAVVGQRMWSRAMNDMQILHALMSGALPKVRDARPDVDLRLERMVVKATSINAADRYSSAAEMQRDLESYLKDLAHPPFGARDIGRFVSDVFADERAQIKSIIDAQLRLLRGTASGEYGVIELPRLSPMPGTPSGVLTAIGERERSREGSGAAMLVPSPIVQNGTQPTLREPRRRSSLWAVVALGAILAIAGSVALFLRSTAARSSTAASTAVGPGLSSAAAGSIAASPAAELGARQPPPDSPAAPAMSSVVPTPQAGQRVSPAGTRTWWHPARPQPAATPTASAAAAPPQPASPPPVVASQPPPQSTATAHVRQQIDVSNPYGH